MQGLKQMENWRERARKRKPREVKLPAQSHTVVKLAFGPAYLWSTEHMGLTHSLVRPAVLTVSGRWAPRGPWAAAPGKSMDFWRWCRRNRDQALLVLQGLAPTRTPPRLEPRASPLLHQQAFLPLCRPGGMVIILLSYLFSPRPRALEGRAGPATSLFWHKCCANLKLEWKRDTSRARVGILLEFSLKDYADVNSLVLVDIPWC